MLTGLKMPAQRPCTARAAMSNPRVGASAAAREATLKAPNETRKTGFAPSRFEIHPAAGIDTHTASRLAVTTHWMLPPAPSDAPICGSAIPTIVESRVTINVPISTTPRAAHRPSVEPGDAADRPSVEVAAEVSPSTPQRSRRTLVCPR